MAVLIPEPASTAPAIGDWQALILKDTKSAGGAELTCRLTNWDNTAEPLVADGSRFEINGSFYEVAAGDEAITGWAGISTGALAYVYATPSGSSAAFSYSSTTPTWDSAKGGWFNGTARALFRVKKTSATAWADKCLMTNGKSSEHVDEVNARAAADAQEVVDRNNAIAAEASARTAADNAEASARAAADNTLQSNINVEAAARAAITTAMMTLGSVGSIALLRLTAYLGPEVPVNPGVDLPGSYLQYSSCGGSSGGSPSGTWRCMGYLPAPNLNTVTLFIRIS